MPGGFRKRRCTAESNSVFAGSLMLYSGQRGWGMQITAAPPQRPTLPTTFKETDFEQLKVEIMTQRKPKPTRPAIDKDAAAFFDRITAEYELTTAGRELLKMACATLTRWRAAKQILDKEGCILTGGNLPRIHPAAKIEHDARLSFCRMLKELNLDDESELV